MSKSMQHITLQTILYIANTVFLGRKEQAKNFGLLTCQILSHTITTCEAYLRTMFMVMSIALTMT